jgi:glucose-6-phosphate 1-dehydrogenase
MSATQTAPAKLSSGMRTPGDHVIVLFGATGDLARRKLLPGLYRLDRAGLLPAGYRIVGTSRRPLSDEAFRAVARAAVVEFGRGELDPEAWDAFAAGLSYASSDAADASALADAVDRAKEQIGGSPRLLHYLSVPPVAFAGIAEALGASGLTGDGRVILEKPFGTDLASARALNAIVHGVFDESQIFRIDHFLGKEAVQNILALRFALEALIDNDRWRGVPCYLRTGKQLAQGRRVITIAFKEPEIQLFPLADGTNRGPNELVFEVAEPGGISASFLAKIPGATLELGPARMEFRYDDSFCAANQLEAYERLIHDALLGDRTLFTRADGIERLWEVATPLLERPPAVERYPPGSWGPDSLNQLIAPRRWHLPEDGR